MSYKEMLTVHHIIVYLYVFMYKCYTTVTSEIGSCV